MNIKSKIKQLIIQSLSDSNITIDTPVIEISTNNRPDINADFATNICMKYASFANMKPIELAELLKEKLDKSTLFVDVIISNPGFINFKVSNELLIEYAMPFKNSTYKPSFESKILNIHYEYVSANPTGDLHIGHARNAVVGDSAIRSLEYIGHNVTKEYWINDYGNQIKTLAESVYYYYSKEAGIENNFEKESIGYHGIEIKELAKKLFEEHQMEFIKDTESESIDSIADISIEHFFNQIKELLEVTLSVTKFDRYVSERKYFEDGTTEDLLKELESKKATYEKDGALWIKTEQEGDDKDRVLRKSDGSTTYMVGDITYHRDKFKGNFDLIIDLWGKDHHGYENRVKAAMSLLGFESEKMEVDFISMVQIYEAGKKMKMSKRAGTSLRIKDMLELMDADLLRWFLLSKSREQNLDIDVEEASKKDSSNPYFYVQYAVARAHQLMNKYQLENKIEDITEFKYIGASEKERDLMIKIAKWSEVVMNTANARDGYIVVNYLRELAAAFHSFYNDSKIIEAEYKIASEQILLVKAFVNVASVALNTIGIKPMEKM